MSQGSSQTYIPERKSKIPFARHAIRGRKTTLRPMTFVQTWDDTQPSIHIDKSKSESQQPVLETNVNHQNVHTRSRYDSEHDQNEAHMPLSRRKNNQSKTGKKLGSTHTHSNSSRHGSTSKCSEAHTHLKINTINKSSKKPPDTDHSDESESPDEEQPSRQDEEQPSRQQMEEFDITSKIPIAHSTAVNVDLHVSEEDEKEDENMSDVLPVQDHRSFGDRSKKDDRTRMYPVERSDRIGGKVVKETSTVQQKSFIERAESDEVISGKSRFVQKSVCVEKNQRNTDRSPSKTIKHGSYSRNNFEKGKTYSKVQKDKSISRSKTRKQSSSEENEGSASTEDNYANNNDELNHKGYSPVAKLKHSIVVEKSQRVSQGANNDKNQSDSDVDRDSAVPSTTSKSLNQRQRSMHREENRRCSDKQDTATSNNEVLSSPSVQKSNSNCSMEIEEDRANENGDENSHHSHNSEKSSQHSNETENEDDLRGQNNYVSDNESQPCQNQSDNESQPGQNHSDNESQPGQSHSDNESQPGKNESRHLQNRHDKKQEAAKLHNSALSTNQHTIENGTKNKSERVVDKENGKELVNKHKNGNNLSNKGYRPIEAQLRIRKAVRETNESATGVTAEPGTPEVLRRMQITNIHTPAHSKHQSYIEGTPVVAEPPPAKRRKLIQDKENKEKEEPQPARAVELWQGDLDTKRKPRDLCDIDLLLNAFQQHTWQFMERLENGIVKNTIRLLGKATVKDLRERIEQEQRLHNSRRSLSSIRLLLKRKRSELLEVMNEHSQTRYELGKLRVQLQQLKDSVPGQNEEETG